MVLLLWKGESGEEEVEVSYTAPALSFFYAFSLFFCCFFSLSAFIFILATPNGGRVTNPLGPQQIE